MYFTTKHTKNTKGKNKIIKKLFVTFLCCVVNILLLMPLVDAFGDKNILTLRAR